MRQYLDNAQAGQVNKSACSRHLVGKRLEPSSGQQSETDLLSGKGQGQLGVKGVVDDEGHYKALGTNLESWKPGTPGVLAIPSGATYTYHAGQNGQQQPRLLIDDKKVAEVPGLSKELTNKLMTNHEKIKDLDIPVVATGTLIWETVDASTGKTREEPGGEFVLGLNEEEATFIVRTLNGAKFYHWLRIKANNGMDAPAPDESKERESAKLVMLEDIGNFAPGSLKLAK